MEEKWCDWWRWKRSLELAGFLDVFIAGAVVAIMTTPALSAVEIPIGSRFVIALGELPAWILSITGVVNFWFIWSLHKKTELIHKETNSMRAALEVAAKAEGKLEGKEAAILEVATAKETQRMDAIADAKAAAEVKIIAEQPKGDK